MSTKTRSRALDDFAENLRRYMDSSGVDAHRLAGAAGVPSKRVEGILAATTEVSLPEFARFTTALGVEPSAMCRALFA